MTRDQLRHRLADAGVRPDAWALDDPHADEAYVLLRDGDAWAVFYSERGERIDEQRFPSESLAADHLFNVVMADPTTRG